jgi:uncharacterized protein
MESGAEVKVLSRKFDGSVRRSWRARLSKVEGSLVVLDGSFDDEILHPLLGTIARGTLSTEYFWTDRWFSIFRFSEPTGRLRNFYCNINTPVQLEAGILTFIDLDIDVLVRPDFSYTVLDEDEFEVNSELYKYPLEYRRRTHQSLAELISMIEKRQFPFSNG